MNVWTCKAGESSIVSKIRCLNIHFLKPIIEYTVISILSMFETIAMDTHKISGLAISNPIYDTSFGTPKMRKEIQKIL